MKKLENLKELEISSDLHLLGGLILRSKKKTKTSKAVGEAVTRLFFYFHESKNTLRLYKKAISDYNLRKNRAIERARKAEKQVEFLEAELKKFKKIVNKS